LQGESLTRVLDELNLTTEDSGSTKTLPTALLTKVDSNSKDETIFDKAELPDSF
jgi:predicted transcriptional regulator